MHRLVEVGTWDAVEADVSPQVTPQLRGFQTHIRRDGIDQVVGGVGVSHNCPPAPAVNAGKDCFVYLVAGRQVVRVGGVREILVAGRQVVRVGGVREIRARFRVWPAYSDGRCAVINYDYDVLSR